MSPPRCPHCESPEVVAQPGREDAGDQTDLITTHECPKCRRGFRYTPPDRERVTKEEVRP